jgi:hypothetical protein
MKLRIVLALLHAATGTAACVDAVPQASRARTGGALTTASAKVTSMPPPTDEIQREPVFLVPELKGPSGAFARLGERCDGAAPAAKSQTDAGRPPPDWAHDAYHDDAFCGTRSVIAGAFGDLYDLDDAPPADGIAIMASEYPVVSSQDRWARETQLHAVMSNGWLWIDRTTCAMCRKQMGWSFLGYLPHLRDEDLRLLQSRLGLPSHPLLRTAEELRSALEKKRTVAPP